MKNQKMFGECALTGEHGQFVRSHLIPLALTRLGGTGEKFVEAGIGHGIKRRSNSWYDYQLVTRSGEDVLADFDARGIELLRTHRLIWSSWHEQILVAEDAQIVDGRIAFRQIHISDAKSLQLFFLSLLWRAGATKRHEFNDVSLSKVELNALKSRLLARDPGLFSDYPVQLFQLVSKGIHHNRTPLQELKTSFGLDGVRGPELQYVRFYFDGLVAYVHLSRGKELPEGFSASCLTQDGPTVVFAHKFEDSRTSRDIQELAETVIKEQLVPSAPYSPIHDAIREGWPLTLDQRGEPPWPPIGISDGGIVK